MRVPRDMLVRGSIRVGVTTRRTAMRVVATTEVLATTLGDRVIRITGTIHPGRLRPMGTTQMDTTGRTRIHTTADIRIHTMGGIPAVTLTTNRGMGTTLERLQRYNAAWVSSATILA